MSGVQDDTKNGRKLVQLLEEPVVFSGVPDDTKNGRKRVQLLQEPVVFVISDDMSESERDLTWWRQEDFEEAKASVKRMCRGLRQTRRFSNSLTDAYEQACGMTSPGSCSLENSNLRYLESLRTNPVRQTFGVFFLLLAPWSSATTNPRSNALLYCRNSRFCSMTSDQEDWSVCHQDYTPYDDKDICKKSNMQYFWNRQDKIFPIRRTLSF
jgi:hypothetical protein